jgi:hypothetical protein
VDEDPVALYLGYYDSGHRMLDVLNLIFFC